jgi:phospholipase C
VWEARRTDGCYDFTVHGADGFVCRFAGSVGATGPRVSARLCADGPEPSVGLVLANDGAGTIAFTTITTDDAVRTWRVGPHEEVATTWPVRRGRYDLTVTADDGSFVRRYAGTCHPARPK